MSKTRYDWSQAPEWAMWIATDADGERCFFENKPEIHDDYWRANGGRLENLDYSGFNWRESLEQRPSGQHDEILPVMPRFFPQPSDIEKLMKDKLEARKINDDLGWTGEWRMSAKDVLDVIIDLQNGA